MYLFLGFAMLLAGLVRIYWNPRRNYIEKSRQVPTRDVLWPSKARPGAYFGGRRTQSMGTGTRSALRSMMSVLTSVAGAETKTGGARETSGPSGRGEIASRGLAQEQTCRVLTIPGG